ncbi:pyridoxamine 5'-phosphate oxidase family protein [Streptomyces sp. PA5.6]|uniref:pyridoxamine 5'-phosphate oxidase family protein n=1 Tax=Streptomyces sp. PA5.6 TaxID=3035651 RepID=UPI003904D263
MPHGPGHPWPRPVNHRVDGDDIVIGLDDGTTLASLTAPADGPGRVVAYEADGIDPDSHLGLSSMLR